MQLSPAGRPARVSGARSQRDWSLLRFGKARTLSRLMLRRERALRKKELAAGKNAGVLRGVLRGVKRRKLRAEFDEAEEKPETEVEVEETESMLSDASTESPSETPAWDTAAARASTPVRAARNPSPPWQGDACVCIDCEMVLPLCTSGTENSIARIASNTATVRSRREYPDMYGWQVGVGARKNRSILARVAVIGEDGRTILDAHVAPTERVTDYRSLSFPLVQSKTINTPSTPVLSIEAGEEAILDVGLLGVYCHGRGLSHNSRISLRRVANA